MNKLLLTTFAVLVLLFSYTTKAHIKVLSTYPENEQVLQGSPDNIQVTYSRNVRLISLQLVQGNSEVDLKYTLNYSPSKEFIIPLSENLIDGDYKFTWTIMGADSHKMEKEIVFSIVNNKE